MLSTLLLLSAAYSPTPLPAPLGTTVAPSSATAIQRQEPPQRRAQQRRPAGRRGNSTETAQPSLARETLTRELPDGVTLTVDSYPPHPKATERGRKPPVAVCFHMAGASRGEYRQIAPQLVKRGMTVLAVDLRSGGDRIPPANATAKSAAEVLGEKSNYLAAYPDIEAGIALAKELHEGSPILLIGSSFSASLVLRYAGEHPNDVMGVMAFSPGNYMDGWKIEDYAAKITAPVYITCGSGERERTMADPIAAAVPANTRYTYWPDADLNVEHGAHAIVSAKPEVRRQLWGRMNEFFNALGPATFQRPTNRPDRPKPNRKAR